MALHELSMDRDSCCLLLTVLPLRARAAALPGSLISRGYLQWSRISPPLPLSCRSSLLSPRVQFRLPDVLLAEPMALTHVPSHVLLVAVTLGESRGKCGLVAMLNRM